MGFKNGAYANVYSAKQNGKVYSCKILIGRTDKKTNEYVIEFTGFVNFAKDAAEKIADLGLPEEQDRNNPFKRKIKLIGTDVTSYFNAEYYNKLLGLASGSEELTKFVKANADRKTFTVWDFEMAEDFDNDSSTAAPTPKNDKKTATKKAASVKKPPVAAEDDGDEELPF